MLSEETDLGRARRLYREGRSEISGTLAVVLWAMLEHMEKQESALDAELSAIRQDIRDLELDRQPVAQPTQFELEAGRRIVALEERLKKLEPVAQEPMFSHCPATLAHIPHTWGIGNNLCDGTAQEQQAAEPEHELRNLLSIIHRDGGHHTEAVGLRQSVEDAHQAWAKLMESQPAPALQAEPCEHEWREIYVEPSDVRQYRISKFGSDQVIGHLPHWCLKCGTLDMDGSIMVPAKAKGKS